MNIVDKLIGPLARVPSAKSPARFAHEPTASLFHFHTFAHDTRPSFILKLPSPKDKPQTFLLLTQSHQTRSNQIQERPKDLKVKNRKMADTASSCNCKSGGNCICGDNCKCSDAPCNCKSGGSCCCGDNCKCADASCKCKSGGSCICGDNCKCCEKSCNCKAGGNCTCGDNCKCADKSCCSSGGDAKKCCQ